jgi:hypothetical protein
MALMVSRSEGYRQGAGKESLALDIVQRFLVTVAGVDSELVTDAERNYFEGDLDLPSGETMECKGQPIDPRKYKKNFVEVFEVTNNARHASGFDDLAALLGLRPDALARVPVTDRVQRRTYALGVQASVSVSIRSIVSSALTTYVNYQFDGRHIYVYERDELVGHICSEVLNGLERGAGKSNEDTFAVRVPVAEMRWERDGAAWIYTGSGTEAAAVVRIQSVALD